MQVVIRRSEMNIENVYWKNIFLSLYSKFLFVYLTVFIFLHYYISTYLTFF